jgi:formate dehydrogenase major subunit/NADH-quinone oxidoreductase subunit G
LIRKDGELVEASWDEALTLVTAKLSAAGAQAAAIATPRMTNEELVLLKNLMTKQIGTANIDHSAGYGHKAVSVGMAKSFGVAASTAAITDIQKAKMIFAVKTDVYETHPVVGFEINMAVKNRGIALNIVSDKRGKLSRLPGAQLTVNKPGSDVLAYTGARLAAGAIAFGEVGPELKADIVRLAHEKARAEGGALVGGIPALDAQYGNVWTDIGETLFAGCAPRPVPSRGHPALIPGASGPLGPARSACREIKCVQWAGCGRSCCSLHRITAFSPSRAARAMRACVLAAVFDP